MAQIIRALDSSVSSISTIHVFPLQYADSKSLASVLTQLFATDSKSSGNNNNNGPGGRGMPPWMGNNGRANAAATPTSAAQQAAMRVVAVADEQSNSVIVNAPEAAMETITEIVNRIDTNIADITETRIFRLQHADSTELANLLNSLYSDSGTTSTSTGGNNANRRPQQTQQSTTSSSSSTRALLQARVVAVADPRTNSLVVTASRDTITQIAVTIGRLDSGDSKKQQVYIFPLENADPDNVATILRGMLGNQSNSSSTSAQPTSSALNQRTVNGASSDISEALNTNSSR